MRSFDQHDASQFWESNRQRLDLIAAATPVWVITGDSHIKKVERALTESVVDDPNSTEDCGEGVEVGIAQHRFNRVQILSNGRICEVSTKHMFYSRAAAENALGT